jgi:hypothetical protein
MYMVSVGIIVADSDVLVVLNGVCGQSLDNLSLVVPLSLVPC